MLVDTVEAIMEKMGDRRYWEESSFPNGEIVLRVCWYEKPVLGDRQYVDSPYFLLL